MKQTIACTICDQLLVIRPLLAREKASCSQCGTVISHHIEDGFLKGLAFAMASLVLLGAALYFPMLGFSAQGQTQSMTLYESGSALIAANESVLGTLTIVLIIIIPLLLMTIQLTLLTAIVRKRWIPGLPIIGRIFYEIRHWNMIEVYVVGVLVSLIKIASLASIELGISFWALIGFSVCFIISIYIVDRHQLWQAIRELAHQQDQSRHSYQHDNDPLAAAEKIASKGTAAEHGIAACDICGTLDSQANKRCKLCWSALHIRHPRSLQRCLAFLATAVLLYIPASIYPIMSTEKLANVSDSTITSGVVLLWHHGSYPIAIIIFIASVVVPIVKMIAIGWLCFVTSRKQSSDNNNSQRIATTHIYEMTEIIGKWSMIDVFVVALLVALVQLGSIMNIQPGPAALAFAGVVVFTMLSARAFDPKLIWDR